jgi:hypothetical protein
MQKYDLVSTKYSKEKLKSLILKSLLSSLFIHIPFLTLLFNVRDSQTIEDEVQELL